MVMRSLLDDAEHWRKRAQETLAQAKMTWKPDAKEKLLEVAKEYDKIARRAEQRVDPLSSETIQGWLAGSLRPPD